jgi:hypothetical protein
MNILFHSNQVGERGTEIALFNYAMGNQNILKDTSFIAAPKNRVLDTDVLKKFTQDFTVCLYETHNELREFIESNKIDLVFKIVHGGRKEDLFHEKIPHFINCVFSTAARHGTFYVPISPFLNRWYRTKYPVLPRIIKQFAGNTETLRDELSIPNDAVVFGGYGGEKQFDIPFVHKTILEVSRKRNDIFFLFMNFKPFADTSTDKNIIFLPRNVNTDYKEKFINTCDAMIHARSDGETFGQAIAEFSIKNRPIITWAPTLLHNPQFRLKTFAKYALKRKYMYADAHLDFLGDAAIRYTSKNDLTDILVNFKEKYLQNINYDCYSEYFNEEKVMGIFKTIYNK